MKQLVIVDFMYLMHKHLYYVKQQEEKLLAAKGAYTPVMSNPRTGEETARLYFALKDLEKILMQYEGDEETQIIVCTDRKSTRKVDAEQKATDYKANRSPSRFNDLDVAAINNTEKAIQLLGIPVLGCEGYEADDIIQSIVRQHKNKFERVLIYTPDADLAVLVDDNVALMRYKGEYSKLSDGTYTLPDGNVVQIINSHALVTKSNFESYFSNEYSKNKAEVHIDYNLIAFYKATVGDPSDNIKGINRFGNSAYMKLRTQLIADHVLEQVIYASSTGQDIFANIDFSKYLSPDQIEAAVMSYNYIKPMLLNIDLMEVYSTARLSRENRKNIYFNHWGISKI